MNVGWNDSAHARGGVLPYNLVGGVAREHTPPAGSRPIAALVANAGSGE